MNATATLDKARRVAEIRAEFPALASGRQTLFGALVVAATPEQELTVSEWADRYRKVSAESGSPFPGDWQTSRVPYLREPTDCLHPDHPARRVTLKFSAQTGKSEVGVNWFGYIVDQAPGPVLTVLPTGEEAAKYNRVKLQPTIDASPRIRHRVKPENSRDESSSTTAFKRFAGGFNQITTASSSKGLQMVSIRWLILDELSGFPLDSDKRGSPAAQARARQKAFGDLAKELAISTPGVAGSCEISQLYDDGDRRRLYLLCPHCGVFQTLRYEAMQAPSASTNWRTTFACAANGCVIDQASMHEMLLRHKWVPTRVEPGEKPVPGLIALGEIDGFAVPPCTGRVRQWQPSWAAWAAYSPFESWTDIWHRGRDAKGDPVREKVFTQQDLGESFEEIGNDLDPAVLATKTDNYPSNVVPAKVGRTVLSVDTQDDRLEWAVYGFGPGVFGSAVDQWLIAAGIIYGDLETAAPWEELDRIGRQPWRHAGGKEFPVDLAGIDSGGHYTQAVYKFVHHKSKWRALKGASKRDAVVLGTPSQVRVLDNFKRVLFKIPLYAVGTHDLKLWVINALKAMEQDREIPGALRLTKDIADERYLAQMTAEVLFAGNRRDGRVVKEWVQIRSRNEALDLAVYARALAFGHFPIGLGVERISQKRWADILSERHGAINVPNDLFGHDLSASASEASTGALHAPAAPPEPKPQPVTPVTGVKRFSNWSERFNT